jgi:hypothetical protein
MIRILNYIEWNGRVIGGGMNSLSEVDDFDVVRFQIQIESPKKNGRQIQILKDQLP